MKKELFYSRSTDHAITALGSQIAVARKEVGWTVNDLAERLGVTRQLVSRIEKGSSSVAIGTVFEAAHLCGVNLFGRSGAGLQDFADLQRARNALLPDRVRRNPDIVDDDF